MTYFQMIAAQYAQRAEETTDETVREFLRLVRDNWLRVADGLGNGLNYEAKEQAALRARGRDT